jgi:hypothetical protein
VNTPYIRGGLAFILCMAAVAGMTVAGSFTQALFLREPLSGRQGLLLAYGGIACFMTCVALIAFSRDLLMNQTTLMGCLLGATPALALLCFLVGADQQWMQRQIIPVLIGHGLLSALAFSAGTQAEAETGIRTKETLEPQRVLS